MVAKVVKKETLPKVKKSSLIESASIVKSTGGRERSTWRFFSCLCYILLNEAFTNHIPLCNIHLRLLYISVAHCCLSPVLPQLTRLPPVPLSYWLVVLGRTLLPSTTNTWLANYQLIFLVLTWTRLLSLALTATDVENCPPIGQNNKWSNLTRGK